MNVLVSFFNQSGNTEKIAKAIYEETSLTNEADLKKLEDVGAEDFAGYDFIFIGSPLHSANLAAPVKEFLTNIQAGSGQKWLVSSPISPRPIRTRTWMDLQNQ